MGRVSAAAPPESRGRRLNGSPACGAGPSPSRGYRSPRTGCGPPALRVSHVHGPPSSATTGDSFLHDLSSSSEASPNGRKPLEREGDTGWGWGGVQGLAALRAPAGTPWLPAASRPAGKATAAPEATRGPFGKQPAPAQLWNGFGRGRGETDNRGFDHLRTGSGQTLRLEDTLPVPVFFFFYKFFFFFFWLCWVFVSV